MNSFLAVRAYNDSSRQLMRLKMTKQAKKLKHLTKSAFYKNSKKSKNISMSFFGGGWGAGGGGCGLGG